MIVQNILSSVSWLGISQGLIFAGFLSFKGRKIQLQRTLLAILYFECSASMIIVTLVNSGLILETEFVRGLEYFMALNVGPMLLFCILPGIEVSSKILKKIGLHLIPGFGGSHGEAERLNVLSSETFLK